MDNAGFVYDETDETLELPDLEQIDQPLIRVRTPPPPLIEEIYWGPDEKMHLFATRWSDAPKAAFVAVNRHFVAVDVIGKLRRIQTHSGMNMECTTADHPFRVICGKSRDPLDPRNRICTEYIKSEVVRVLEFNRTRKIYFTGRDGLLSLSSYLWGNFEHITLILEADVMRSYIPRMRSCKTLKVRTNFEANADEIISAMPSIRSLHYHGPIKFSNQSLNLLRDKINLGSGLVSLSFFPNHFTVAAQQFVNFLVAVKFNKENRDVSISGLFVNSTRMEFYCLMAHSLVFKLPTVDEVFFKKHGQRISLAVGFLPPPKALENGLGLLRD